MAYILLVNPNRVSYPPPEHDFTGDEVSPPLGLLSLAAVLREQGHDVEVFDSQTSEEPYEDFLSHRTGLQHPTVGFSCVFPYRERAREYIQTTFAAWPSAFVIVGGPDATFAPSEYLRYGAKVVVLGEGETSLPQLLANRDDLSVSGIAFMGHDGRVQDTGRPAPLDMDTLPFPARDLVNLNRYNPDVTSMISSRGCRHHCSFCSSREFWGSQYRTRSPSLIAQEIERIYEDAHFEKIRHQDDNWAERDDRFLRELQDELHRMGLLGKIEHEIETSPSSLLGNRKVDLLRRMGVTTVWMGMETADDTLRMNFLRKPYTYHQVKEAVALLKQARIEVGLFLIFGMPQETYADAVTTIDRTSELEPDYVGVSILTRYPGTTLYRELPGGAMRQQMLSDMVGWGHSGEFLGKKMTVDELLKVFAYAYLTFKDRLGNCYNLERLFSLPQDTAEILAGLEAAEQRLGFLSKKDQLEQVLGTASPYARAAISVEIEARAKNGRILEPFVPSLCEVVNVPLVQEQVAQTRRTKRKSVIRLAIKSRRVLRDALISLVGIGGLVAEGVLLHTPMWYMWAIYGVTATVGLVGGIRMGQGLLRIHRARSMAHEIAPHVLTEGLDEYRTRNVNRITGLVRDELESRGIEFVAHDRIERSYSRHRITLHSTPISEIQVETVAHSGSEFDPSLVDPLFDLYEVTTRISFGGPVALDQFLELRDKHCRLLRQNRNEAQIVLRGTRWLPWSRRSVYINEGDVALLERAIRDHVLPFLATE